MWSILVFVASFILVFSATFSVFPSIPPGQLIFEIFGNPEADYIIFIANNVIYQIVKIASHAMAHLSLLFSHKKKIARVI